MHKNVYGHKCARIIKGEILMRKTKGKRRNHINCTSCNNSGFVNTGWSEPKLSIRK